MNLGNITNKLQLTQEPLHLRAIQQNFRISFGISPEIDEITPHVAFMLATEIQSHVGNGHPLRVYMFNYLSADAYANADFQNLVRITVLRIVLGVNKKEFGNYALAAQALVPACCKFAASWLASQEPAMIDFLDNELLNNVIPVNAQTWQDIAGMVDGLVAFQPLTNFVQNNNTSAIGNLIGRGIPNNSNTNSIGGGYTGTGATSGAFVTGVSNSQGGTSGNTVNPGGRVNRFRRALQEKQAALAGSLQTSMVAAAEKISAASAIQPSQGVSRAAPGWQRPAKRTIGLRGTVHGSQEQTQIEEAIDEAIPATVEEPQQAPEPVTRKSLFAWPGEDGKDYRVYEEVTGVDANIWTSHPAQRFHPAWCMRTHYIRYFLLENNNLVAIPAAYSQEQLEVTMNYDAHAIDPSMGKPLPKATPSPVREEAKILYASEKELHFNIRRMDDWDVQESVETAIQLGVMDAECLANSCDAVIKNSAVNTPVIYETTVEAMKDLELLEKINSAHSFIEAAELIEKLSSKAARDMINKWMTARVNRMVSCELGVKLTFTNFLEDAPNIIAELSKDLGSNIDTLIARQQFIISGVVCGVSASSDSMTDYVDNILTGTPEERAAWAERTIFLTRDVSVTWVKFNASELSVGIPSFGSGVVAKTLFPALHGIIEATLTEKTAGSGSYFDNILISRDGKKFRIHSSVLGGNARMISNYF